MTDKSLSVAAKGLYSYLAVFCNAERECYPSRERIADELGITKDYLGKLLRELVNIGVLEITHEKAAGGRFSRNRYRLTDPPCLVSPDTVSPDTVSPGTVSPGTVSPGTVSQDANNTIFKKTIFKNTDTQQERGTSSPAPSPAKKKQPNRFTPPTVDEVRTYCRERGSTVDAEQFVAFYESKGWLVGKSPMKNWKSAVVTWEKRDREEGKRSAPAENDPYRVELPY